MTEAHATLRSKLLAEIERDLEEARAASAYTAITALHRLRVQILHADEERPPLESEPRPSDPLDLHLWEIRVMRREAQGAGSWVAAASLMKQEAEALAAIDARNRDTEARARLAHDDGAILAEIEAVLDGLPQSLVAELAAAIERRRSELQ